MMEDLLKEEHDLEALRSQLNAVQQIGRELEKKDEQIATLKLKLTEAQSFRDQAISLRTQCRILEEKVSLTDTAKQELMDRVEEREKEWVRQLSQLREEKRLMEQREDILTQVNKEQESRIEQVEAEGRQLQEALSRALQAEQDAKRRLELLEAESQESRQELTSLHETLQDVRSDLHREKVTLEELGPTKTALKDLTESHRRLREDYDRVSLEAKKVPALQEQVNEVESLRRLLLAAEKEAITAKTVVETEKITSSSLHKEIESLKQVVAQQDKYIEQLEKEGSRARVMEEELSTVRRRLEATKSESTDMAVEAGRLKKEQRLILAQVEGFLSMVKRAARAVGEGRGVAEEARRVSGPDYFAEDHETMAQNDVWIRLREVVWDVRGLLEAHAAMASTAKDHEDRNMDLEAQHLTLVAKMESMEEELLGLRFKLQQAQASAAAMDVVMADLRQTIQDLECTTRDLTSELNDRDRFLVRLIQQLQGLLGPAESPILANSGDLSSYLMEDGGDQDLVLPHYSSYQRADFTQLQTSISTALAQVKSTLGAAQTCHREALEQVSHHQDELNEERRMHKALIEEMRARYELELSEAKATMKGVEEAMQITRERSLVTAQEANAKLEAEVKNLRTQLERVRDQNEQMTLRVIGLQGERDVLDSSTSRSVDAMRLLARVALGMSQRCRQLAQQKTFLLRQARTTQKLQWEVAALATAVVGEYDTSQQGLSISSSRGAGGGPLLQSLGLMSVPSLRAVAIAVLFANRIIRCSRSRPTSSRASTSTNHHHVRIPLPSSTSSYLTLSMVEEDAIAPQPVLPSKDELAACPDDAARVKLVIRRLKQPGWGDNTSSTMNDSFYPSSPSDQPSLLTLLALGEREHAQRLNERGLLTLPTRSSGIGGGGSVDDSISLSGGEGELSWRRLGKNLVRAGRLRRYNGGGTTAVDLQTVRKGLLAMVRVIQQNTAKARDLQEEKDTLGLLLQEQYRVVTERQEAVDLLERQLSVLRAGMGELERARQDSVPLHEYERVTSDLRNAVLSVEELQVKVRELTEQLEALTGYKDEAQDLKKELNREKERHRHLSDELSQWRRYAMKSQQENTELHARSFTTTATTGGLKGSPIRGCVRVNTERIPSRPTGIRSLEDIEALINRLASAEVALDGDTTNADTLSHAVKKLVSERLEQETALKMLRAEVQQAYNQQDHLRQITESRSKEVLKELENTKRRLEEVEAARKRDALRQRDLVKQHLQAESELNEVLHGTHPTTTTGGASEDPKWDQEDHDPTDTTPLWRTSDSGTGGGPSNQMISAGAWKES